MKSNVNIGGIGDNHKKEPEISRVVKSLLATNEIPAFTLDLSTTDEHQKRLLTELEKGFNLK